jgi:hypothetical protein
VGVIAPVLLVTREILRLLQFGAFTVAIGVVLYVPGITETLAKGAPRRSE